ncbi:MAG TPA: carbohydrate kinase family protein [Candidatus Paenalcaligenes intestinipullorum]|uniref:Carbohydrate kinase family protein n=1 Tax=Candidatus Paenalcaligenes intestinipullorum TaxID=2838718 RepID=A0A9D2RHL0_9BURK|nr:carbohydrate kinase family protein [Candidatus Paenalcaligenes intestinipullorum]
MKVVTVGNVNLDVVVLESSAPRLPGDKNDVEAINLYAGGGAFNGAYSFRALGAEVEVASTVGADFEGEWLHNKLRSIGARDTCFNSHPNFATSKAVIQVQPQGRATVQAYRGASQDLQLPCLNALLDWADVLYVAPVAERAITKVLQALEQSSNSDLKVVVIPAAQGLHEQQAPLKQLLKRANVVCMNFVEAQLYLGRGELLPETEPTPAMTELIHELQTELDTNVVVTLVPAGCVFYDGERTHYQAAYPIARICSTIGAGDAFASTFSFHFLAQTHSVPECLALASRYSAAVLQAPGANLG